MLLKCRLFYLLKEFTAVHICAVYIPPDANAKLVLLAQDCFHRTTWDVFKGEGTFTCESLDEYIASMLYYINFCVDSVTSWKPWMTHNVQQLIRARNIAYRSGDANAYSLARTALRKGINAAKLYHKRRIEANLSNCTKPRQVWEGIKSITDYKITFTSPSESSGATLAEELNIFYSCFDRENTDPELPPLLTIDPAPVLNTRGVRLVFCSIKPRKAAGPDGVLKDSVADLADVFTYIYNMSLLTSWVSACFKAATIVPIPKQFNVKCLNDYRTVAHTSVPAKCLERLIIKHIKEARPSTLDPYQFSYRENRSTEDAIAIVLHTLLEHLKLKNTYARMLFVDYSSAFNNPAV